jgi:hypothetical protein
VTLYRGYAAAGNVCSGGPTPGAKQLMAWFLGAYRSVGSRNDGIYNCRTMRGSTFPSVHGEGRAADLGNPPGAAWAPKLADQLRLNSAELGIQCIIFNRRIWSGAHPDAGWRSYAGVDPHNTHLHVELSRKAAQGLTVARIVAVLTPPKETDMPTAAEVAAEVIKQLTEKRVIPNDPLHGEKPTANWTFAGALGNVEKDVDLLREDVKAMTAKVDALTAALAHTQAGGITPEALASALIAHLKP